MDIQLGMDTLTYHCRLEAGEISLEQVLRESAALGFAFVQLNAHHVRDRSDKQIADLATTAHDLGLGVTLAGDVVGLASRGDTPAKGASRVARWLELAEIIDSPYARMSSGFYRAEYWRRDGAIRAEQDFLIAALSTAADANSGGRAILLENHSDFSPEEYVEIIQAVGLGRLGVFLDLINPVSSFAEPLDVVTILEPWAPAGHIKDFRLSSNYVEGGFHRRGFSIEWCYPGEGVADLGSLLQVLARSERLGPYLLSIEGLDSRVGVADQVDRLAASRDLIRALLAPRESAEVR